MTLLWWRLRYRIRHGLMRRPGYQRLEAGFALGPPMHPPYLTRQAAVHIAFPHPPATARLYAEYVRCKDLSLRHGIDRGDGSLQREYHPPFDAWKVVGTGLSIPRPGGRSSREPRPLAATTLLVIVDDKKGIWHGATGNACRLRSSMRR